MTKLPKLPKASLTRRIQSRTQALTFTLYSWLLPIDIARPRYIKKPSAQAGDCLGNTQMTQGLLLTVSNRQWTMARATRVPAIGPSLARRALGQKAKRKSCAARACWLRVGWSRGVGGRRAVVSAYDGSTNNFCISSGYRRCKQFLHLQPHTIFTLFFL